MFRQLDCSMEREEWKEERLEKQHGKEGLLDGVKDRGLCPKSSESHRIGFVESQV